MLQTYSLHEKWYTIGNTVIKLLSPEFTESDYLSNFRCTKQAHADVIFKIVPNKNIDSPLDFSDGETVKTVKDYRSQKVLWRTYSQKANIQKTEYDPSKLPLLNTFTVTEMMDLPKLLLKRDSVILHSSFIVADSKAILFTAPKQTGKSTQARLWEESGRATTINGDRALIEKKCDEWYASGIPFCGTSGICKTGSFPIKAIIILSQAKENKACCATSVEAARALISGCSFDKKDSVQTEKFFEIAENLISEVNFINYGCTPDKEAMTYLERFLMELKK